MCRIQPATLKFDVSRSRICATGQCNIANTSNEKQNTATNIPPNINKTSSKCGVEHSTVDKESHVLPPVPRSLSLNDWQFQAKNKSDNRV